jgi:DNA-binding CsgD family transcriptional regulator
MPRQEIAIRLGVSRSTVDTHLKRIYAKLGVHDRMLAARAYRQATGDDT